MQMMSDPIKPSHLITVLNTLKSISKNCWDVIKDCHDPSVSSPSKINNEREYYRVTLDSIRKQNKQALCNNMFDLLVQAIEFRKAINDLEETLKDYEIINTSHQKLTENIVKSIAEDAKTILRPEPPVQSRNVAKKPVVLNDKQVLVINDLTKSDIDHGKLFSSALKNNLSEKLGGIPVTKSTISKQGKAILTFPDAETCSKAKKSLETNFNVTNSDRKQKIILPRVKIHNLEPHLMEYDNEELCTKFHSKNEVIADASSTEFSITFIDKKQCFAIAKVSPNIHEELIKTGRLFIDLSSYRVSNHYSIIQCFKCQSFNHTSNSSLCKYKDNPQISICLYCSKNHKSSQCPSKKDKNCFKCNNCLKSNNPSIKNGASSHTSTDHSCPMYIKEIEWLKINTCYDQEMFNEIIPYLTVRPNHPIPDCSDSIHEAKQDPNYRDERDYTVGKVFGYE